MKGFFSRDSVLKVLSFVVAVLIWFYIIIVVDPSVDLTISDIPIRYANEASLSEHGLSMIDNGKATVELKIRGSRKKIANIDNKNVYATADLANITKTGTFSLPISISIPYEYNEIVSKKPNNTEVVIDRVIELEKEIGVATSGSVANGYIAGEPTVSTKTVILEGASTVLDRIKGVAASLDYDDRAAAIKDTEKLYFIDNNGKRISDDDKIYDMVSMNISTIEITCPVYRLKTVPVKVNIGEEPDAVNYNISVQPANITVYAENEILSEITEIFTEPIDWNALMENGEVTVKISTSEGVMLRDGINEVSVKAKAKS